MEMVANGMMLLNLVIMIIQQITVNINVIVNILQEQKQILIV